MRKGELVLELSSVEVDGEERIMVHVTGGDHGSSWCSFYRRAGMALFDWLEAAGTLAGKAGYVELPSPRDALAMDVSHRATFLAIEDRDADEKVFTATGSGVGALTWVLHRQVIEDMYARAAMYTEDGEEDMAEVAAFDLVLAIQDTGQPVVVLPSGKTLTLESHSIRLVRHYVSTDEQDDIELVADEGQEAHRGDITAELLTNRGGVVMSGRCGGAGDGA